MQNVKLLKLVACELDPGKRKMDKMHLRWGGSWKMRKDSQDIWRRKRQTNLKRRRWEERKRERENERRGP